MEFTEKFKFLSVQLGKRKEKDTYYLLVQLIDKNNNPCKFFGFDDELIKKVTSMNLQGLQDVTVNFSLNYSDKGWAVRLNDINPIPTK